MRRKHNVPDLLSRGIEQVISTVPLDLWENSLGSAQVV